MVALGLELGDDDEGKHHFVLVEAEDRRGVSEEHRRVEHVGAGHRGLRGRGGRSPGGRTASRGRARIEPESLLGSGGWGATCSAPIAACRLAAASLRAAPARCARRIGADAASRAAHCAERRAELQPAGLDDATEEALEPGCRRLAEDLLGRALLAHDAVGEEAARGSRPRGRSPSRGWRAPSSARPP